MEFRVLGPLEVCRDGEVLDLAGAKARALLAVLLARANEAVSADRLIDELWGEQPPDSPRKALQMQVLRVRRALGSDVLVSEPGGYRLVVGPDALDATRCKALVDQGRSLLAEGSAPQAHERLTEAVGIWRGPPLADLAYEPSAQTLIAQLEALRVNALEALADAQLALGRHADAVGDLQRLVADHPLHERFHAQLMLALYRCGRQSDALEAYRTARTVLVDQLGIEPGGELRELERAVLTHDPALQPSAPRIRVPLPPTRTIGREAVLTELAAVVGDARLVTVVGAGGVGKTRVAVELARAAGPGMHDGAVFVSLAPLASSEHVASAIARELDVTPAPSEPVENALARHVARRQLLLVIDNFEHVLDAAPLIADLVAGAPGLKVLATSREPLRLRAERLFRLDPLPVAAADGESPAATLFADVVRAHDPTFTLAGENLTAASEVCRRVDGLPLAIELAAGRVGLLSASDVATRLRSGLDALDAAPRDAPDRQRTLTATLEWSFALLDDREQQVFVALAAFAGGCELDAAQAVSGATVEQLESLVAKNLVLAQAGRLVMLETVRAFARARLEQRSDADEVKRRHCEHHLALAERTQPELERSASPAVVAEVDGELDNVRAAFAWALEHSPELALRIATATAMYWELTEVRAEAAAWLSAALARADDAVPAAVRARALQHYAVRAAKPSTIETAERAARESLELQQSLNDLSGCSRSASALAHVLVNAYRSEEAYGWAGEALRLAEAADDRQARVWALVTMAWAAPTIEETLRLVQKAAAMHRAAGNQRQLAAVQTSVAYSALRHGEYEVAESLAGEGLAAARALDDPFVLALAEGNMGLAALFNGSLEAAERAFASELRLGSGYGFDSEYADLLYEAVTGLAAIAAARGNDRAAATLSGAAEGATDGSLDPAIDRQVEARFLQPARERLGERAWQDAYAAGAALDHEQAIDAALQSLRPRAVA